MGRERPPAGDNELFRLHSALAPPAEDGRGWAQSYGFTGKEEDVEVGLTYFGKRFLNPQLGRWVSADPLAVHAPGEADLNLYAYVSGAVLKAVDPVGLSEFTDAEAEAIGTSVEGGTVMNDGTFMKPGEGGAETPAAPGTDARKGHAGNWAQRGAAPRTESTPASTSSTEIKGRSRAAGGDFQSDAQGRQLLAHWMGGAGQPLNLTNDPGWTDYMSRQDSLRLQLRPEVIRMAQSTYGGAYSAPSETMPISSKTHADLTPGEGIVGSQYLGGTNRTVGDFQMVGEATRSSTASGVNVSMKLGFTWNDIMDPNRQYGTDVVKSFVANVISLGRGQDYEIHISWTSAVSIDFDSAGKMQQMTGYPLAP